MSYPSQPTQPWCAGLPPEGDPGTLDLPWYGIGPVEAVTRAYRKAFRYDGRASRGEYWWFALFQAVAMLVVYLALVFPVALTADSSSTDMDGMFALLGLLMAVAGLHFAVVGLPLSIRRLHDAGMSGWTYLICLVPYLGGLVLLIFMCQSPKPEGTRYDRGYAQWQITAAYGVAEAPYGYPVYPR